MEVCTSSYFCKKADIANWVCKSLETEVHYHDLLHAWVLHFAAENRQLSDDWLGDMVELLIHGDQ